MLQDQDIGNLYQDRETKCIYLLIGFMIHDNRVAGALAHLTTIYIDKTFRQNSAVNLALYFVNLRDSIFSEPLKQAYLVYYDKMNYYEKLDLDLYEIPADLFHPDAISKWILKSTVMGTFTDSVYANIADAQDVLYDRKLKLLGAEKQKRMEELKGFHVVTPDELRPGYIYRAVLQNRKYIFLEKEADCYKFMKLNAVTAERLDNLKNNDKMLYQFLLDVVKRNGAEFCKSKKLRDDLVFYKDLGLANFFNYLNIRLSLNYLLDK